MYGTYETVDDRPALTFERLLAHPVERVWRAVTDPTELAHWFPSRVSGQVALGGRLSFEFPGDDLPPLEGEVVELEPPHRFAFNWGDGSTSYGGSTSGDGRGQATHTYARPGTYTITVDPSGANTGSLNLSVTNP